MSGKSFDCVRWCIAVSVHLILWDWFLSLCGIIVWLPTMDIWPATCACIYSHFQCIRNRAPCPRLDWWVTRIIWGPVHIFRTTEALMWTYINKSSLYECKFIKIDPKYIIVHCKCSRIQAQARGTKKYIIIIILYIHIVPRRPDPLVGQLTCLPQADAHAKVCSHVCAS